MAVRLDGPIDCATRYLCIGRRLADPRSTSRAIVNVQVQVQVETCTSHGWLKHLANVSLEFNILPST